MGSSSELLQTRVLEMLRALRERGVAAQSGSGGPSAFVHHIGWWKVSFLQAHRLQVGGCILVRADDPSRPIQTQQHLLGREEKASEEMPLVWYFYM